jgi:hypothetical protein
MAKRIRTNPEHKAHFSLGVRCTCSCGWQSAMWLNKGAKQNAAAEWRNHREKCEAEIEGSQVSNAKRGA